MVQPTKVNISKTMFEKADKDTSKYTANPGITEEVVRMISKTKNEPQWMLNKRLKAFALFKETEIPTWGPDLELLDLNSIVYFIDPNATETDNWDEVPAEIKNTFDRLGIPEAEKTVLAGVGAQYDSSVVYHSIQKSLQDKGVIFENMDVAIQRYPELVQKYFMTSCIPITDHKFIMLHAAVWSGGTFIFVPKNVKVDLPLQAYFRMNAQKGGQFEHTLIILDEGAELHYIEGCSSPRYAQSSLHAGCVEVHVMKDAIMRYTSIENWSKNVYNLNTKRALVHEDAKMIWTNGNMGCLTGDSKIFTRSNGPIQIQDIKEGDKVLVWDEKTNSITESPVKEKMYSGVKKVYRLEAGSRNIEASGNHPFLTLNRKKNNPSHRKGFLHFEWKPLELLKKGDVVGIIKKAPLKGEAYTLPSFDYDYEIKSKNQYADFSLNARTLYNQKITFPSQTTADFMWVMGNLLGDGHIDYNSNKINIAIHKSANDFRPEFIRVIKSLFNYQIKDTYERYVEIYSKVLCELFTQIGFDGCAGTKSVPSWVYQLPEEQILAFLAGYFDTDGHAGASGIYYTSINKKVLEDIQNLAIMCGFGVTNIFEHRKKGRAMVVGNECTVQDSWRILLNGQRIHDLPSRSMKKKAKIVKIKGLRNYGCVEGLNFRSKTNEEIGFVKIDEIIPLGEKKTYDLEIKKYHNFIANGLIVHNSARTMLYPCSVLVGRGAKTESIGIAFAGKGQNQDTGTKVIHAASDTSSFIQSKSISKDGGVSSYRGLVKIIPAAKNCKSRVQCDALMMDGESVSNTYPFMKIDNATAQVSHEATVGKITDDQIFYLMSRGLSEAEATKLIISGFIEPIVKALPLEYAVELNKLIELEVEGL